MIRRTGEVLGCPSVRVSDLGQVACHDGKAPILIWNTQMIYNFSEDADCDMIMLNSGMAGLSEVTGALVRTNRPFSILTGHLFRIANSSKKLSKIRLYGASKVRKFMRRQKNNRDMSIMTILMITSPNSRYVRFYSTDCIRGGIDENDPIF